MTVIVDGLLVAEQYVNARLIGLLRHSNVVDTVQGKHIPVLLVLILKGVNFRQY